MPMPDPDWNLEDVLEKIEKNIMEDTHHPGDVIVLEVSDSITLEEELAMFQTAVKTLHLRGCEFVKVKTRRSANA